MAVAVKKANAPMALRFAGPGRPFVINIGLGKILRLALALPAHFAKTEQGAALAQIGQPAVEAAGGGEVVAGPGKVRFAPQIFYFFRAKATGSMDR